MLIRWCLGFFIVAVIAAIFGFGGIASEMAGIARLLFGIFLIIFLVTLVMHLLGYNRR